jgi:hypothetical protein
MEMSKTEEKIKDMIDGLQDNPNLSPQRAREIKKRLKQKLNKIRRNKEKEQLREEIKDL